MNKNQRVIENDVKNNNHNMTGSDWKTDLMIAFFAPLICISGLVVNAIQLINYMTIRLFSVHCYRYINSFLQYIILSQLVAICEWWGRCSLTIYYGDEESKRLFGKDYTIGVTNHRYEVDPAFFFWTGERVDLVGRAKAFAKKSLRYVPIMGWQFFFAEYIFVDRNFEKDSKNIGRALDRLMEHRQNVIIMMASEGTRFTVEKYNNSMKFAKEKGLDVHFTYHLLPRVRGFAYSVRYLKENHPKCVVYNIQLAFDESVHESGADYYSVSNFIRGVPMHGSVYVKRIPISDIPTDSDEEITDFLYKLYAEKDRLMEFHREKKRFPGIPVPHERRLLPLVVLWANLLIVGVPFICLLFYVFISGSLVVISFTSMFIIGVYFSIYVTICAAKIDKCSPYGKKNDCPNGGALNGNVVHSKVD